MKKYAHSRIAYPCAMRLRKSLVIGASALVMGAAASPALAQSSNANMIEELVVTAEKREQSLQDVPVAVSAYTSEKRDILGVSSVEDLARMTPSVSYTNNDDFQYCGLKRLIIEVQWNIDKPNLKDPEKTGSGMRRIHLMTIKADIDV